MRTTAVSDSVTSPLAGIPMSPHDRLQAERHMRNAEQLVDFVFTLVAGWQGLVRRVHGLRLAQSRRRHGHQAVSD